jgi:DNA-binding CsgD family transcriptional regulator
MITEAVRPRWRNSPTPPRTCWRLGRGGVGTPLRPPGAPGQEPHPAQDQDQHHRPRRLPAGGASAPARGRPRVRFPVEALRQILVQNYHRDARAACAGGPTRTAGCRRMGAARPLACAEALPRVALTDREEEVLRSMATALSNPEIAESLTVSLETVKTHVGEMC